MGRKNARQAFEGPFSGNEAQKRMNFLHQAAFLVARKKIESLVVSEADKEKVDETKKELQTLLLSHQYLRNMHKIASKTVSSLFVQPFVVLFLSLSWS